LAARIDKPKRIVIGVSDTHFVRLLPEIHDPRVERHFEHVWLYLHFQFAGPCIAPGNDVPIRYEIVLLSALPNKARRRSQRPAIGALLKRNGRE